MFDDKFVDWAEKQERTSDVDFLIFFAGDLFTDAVAGIGHSASRAPIFQLNMFSMSSIEVDNISSSLFLLRLIVQCVGVGGL